MTAVVGLGFQASPDHVPFGVFQGILLCSLERKEIPDILSEECKPVHTVKVGAIYSARLVYTGFETSTSGGGRGGGGEGQVGEPFKSFSSQENQA